MSTRSRDITGALDLAESQYRAGPMQERRPRYTDLLPPCNNACPAGENIQAWLSYVRRGDDETAWRQLTQDNPFPAIHGRVCYHPCETSCNRADLDETVGIHGVERHLGDAAIAGGWRYPTPLAESGRRVLVVGAGPSGLSAAFHLRQLGHDVEIRDNSAEPGGMMRYGIPAYRLPRDVLDAEIARLVDSGVRIVCDHTVTDLQAEREGFDAVFVAVGAHLSRRTDIPAQDSASLIDAVSFLRGAASGQEPAGGERTPQDTTDEARPLLGRRVAVYGGGNTAMDAARTARRLGAESATIIYRRTRAQMPAHEEEATDAEAEGVRMNWLRTIHDVGEKVTVEVMELDENGWPVGTGRFEELEADTVILALGQTTDTSLLSTVPGIEFSADGVVQVDPRTLMTGAPGVFAGGDAVPSERTVTVGTGHGKRAARAIDAYLRATVGDDTPAPGPAAAAGKHSAAPGNHREPVGFNELNLWYFGPQHSRRAHSELTERERVSSFGEVVGGYTPEQARFEATRCLSCGNCFECDGCVGSCPESAVLPLGPGNRYEFDYERCTGCGSCHDQCPVHAIEMVPQAETGDGRARPLDWALLQRQEGDAR
ncbi:MAG: NAD(P)-binding protein [Actinomycetales bacterium]